MHHPDPVDTGKPWFMLVLGSALSLLGLLIGVGGRFVPAEEIGALPGALPAILEWGPATCLCSGTALAMSSLVVLSAGWFARRA